MILLLDDQGQRSRGEGSPIGLRNSAHAAMNRAMGLKPPSLFDVANLSPEFLGHRVKGYVDRCVRRVEDHSPQRQILLLHRTPIPGYRILAGLHGFAKLADKKRRRVDTS